MTKTLSIVQSSINKANAAKDAAKAIAEKYPELLRDPAICEFVKLLTSPQPRHDRHQPASPSLDKSGVSQYH